MPLLTTDLALARRSYYAATVQRGPSHPALEGTQQCDVAVVGGGLAGLSAALELSQRGFQVTVLESHELGYGASGRNGGQVIHGLACDPETIEAQLGPADARRVWDMTVEAVDLVRERIACHAIACEWRDGFLTLAVGERKARALQAWADRIESVYGYRLERIGAADIGRWIASPRFHGGLHDARSGHLHPLKYALGVARAAAAAGVILHEHSAVTAIRPGPTVQVETLHGRVRARHVLLATNVYLGALAPRLAARIMPVGTYVAATASLPRNVADALIPTRAAACDSNFALDYFRPTDDDRLLYGGLVSYSTATPGRLPDRLRTRMLATFPQLADARIEFAWGGFIDITMNRAPDFGRLPADGAHLPNIYYLQGFSGHGLALAGMAGRLVAEAIAGDATRLDVFSRIRHRAFPGGRWLRTPSLVLGMAWHRLRDLLG